MPPGSGAPPRKNDLAVISVDLADIPESIRPNIRVAAMGDSDALQVGNQVVAIGNALGYGQSATSGYVSALNQQVASERGSAPTSRRMRPSIPETAAVRC